MNELLKKLLGTYLIIFSAIFIYSCGEDPVGNNNNSEYHYVPPTETADGRELMVFNWAPTQWDDPLDHYTVKVVYPIDVQEENPGRDVLENKLLDM